MERALLVIDVQKDYYPGGRMEVPEAGKVGHAVAKLLAAHRQAGLPVVHIRHETLRPGATFLVPGTAGTDIHPDAEPTPGEALFTKNFPNSFRNTGLGGHLAATGARKLTVCGMMTHMCIDTTVRAAFDLGFEITLVHDACAAPALVFEGRKVAASDVHASFVAAMGAVFAKIQSTAEYVAALGG